MVLLWSLARAAECDAPFTPDDVSALVDDARTAVENDDVSTFKQTYRTFTRRVVCLEGPVPTEPWAALLVLDAIVRFAEGAGADVPLATARAIDPDVEVPAFLDDLSLPKPRDPLGPLGPGAKLYVDGVQVEAVPSLEGDHVIQRPVGWKWESLVGSAVPRVWTAAPGPVLSQREGRGFGLWSVAGLSVGVQRSAQRPDAPGDYLPEGTVVAPGVAVRGEARVRIDNVGAYARAGLPLWIGRLSGGGVLPTVEADAGALYAYDSIQAEIGAVFALSPVLEGGKDQQRFDLLPALGVRWIDEGLDAGLAVAAWADSQRATARGGWSTPMGPGRFRVGLELAAARRAYEQALPNQTRDLRTSTLSAGLSAGLVLE